MKLLTFALEAALQKAKFTALYTNIPNNHPVMANELPRLKAIAECLGVDFDATGYTFTVKSQAGATKIYDIVVQVNPEGIPVLVWGNLNTPLSELKAQYSIEGDKYSHMEFYGQHEELPEVMQLEVNLMMTKEAKAAKINKAQMRVALSTGTLDKYLVRTFVKPEKLNKLADGMYQVTKYELGDYQGDTTASIYIEGFGWYRANKSLALRLSVKPNINSEVPATLSLANTGKLTAQGHPIMDTKLATAEDAAIPVYDFSDGLEVPTESVEEAYRF